MEKQKFYSEIEEMLETEDKIMEDTNLRELEEYDSMVVLSLIAFIDENFSKKLSGEQFKDIITVKSLMDKIGADNFS